MPDHAMKDPNNLLLGQKDGSFKEEAKRAGLIDFVRARGGALVDLNLDGLLDVVAVHRQEPVGLWRNVGAGKPAKPKAMGRWLDIELGQDGPNADAIGAWIEVKAAGDVKAREVTVGGGHASGQLGPTHFGLGKTKRPEVRVTWPDGEVGEWMKAPADQRIRIERGADEPIVLEAPGDTP